MSEYPKIRYITTSLSTVTGPNRARHEIKLVGRITHDSPQWLVNACNNFAPAQKTETFCKTIAKKSISNSNFSDLKNKDSP